MKARLLPRSAGWFTLISTAFCLLVAIGILQIVSYVAVLFGTTSVTDYPVFPPGIGQKAWFTTVKSGLTGNLTEANASAFLSGTGIIQIGVKVNSGSATAGTITVYTQLADGDTVYAVLPTATFSLTASASKVSDPIQIGPGYHKLVVSSAAGTFNFDLTVKDF